MLARGRRGSQGGPCAGAAAGGPGVPLGSTAPSRVPRRRPRPARHGGRPRHPDHDVPRARHRARRPRALAGPAIHAQHRRARGRRWRHAVRRDRSPHGALAHRGRRLAAHARRDARPGGRAGGRPGGGGDAAPPRRRRRLPRNGPVPSRRRGRREGDARTGRHAPRRPVLPVPVPQQPTDLLDQEHLRAVPGQPVHGEDRAPAAARRPVARPCRPAAPAAGRPDADGTSLLPGRGQRLGRPRGGAGRARLLRRQRRRPHRQGAREGSGGWLSESGG